jgi:predicted transcriptional regulator
LDTNLFVSIKIDEDKKVALLKVLMPRAGTILSQVSEKPEDFGKWLRSFRESQQPKITQSELSKGINYSQRLISDIETGKHQPTEEFKNAVKEFVEKSIKDR